MNLLLAMTQAGGGGGGAWGSPLHGFEASTWAIVVVNGLGGLLVAVRCLPPTPQPPPPQHPSATQGD